MRSLRLSFPKGTTMSQVSIANRALSLLGANKIANIADETPEASAVQTVWDGALRSILSEACWGFASKRQMLNRLTVKPAFGKGNYFQRPNDCIRIFDVSDRNVKWRVEGDKILAESEAFGILYTYLEQNDAVYFPAFVDAFACKLAAEMCFELTNSASRYQELIGLYKGEFLPVAKTENSRSRTPDEIKDDLWRNAVYGWRAG